MSEEFGFRELKQLTKFALACALALILVDVVANAMGYKIEVPLFHDLAVSIENGITAAIRWLRVMIARYG